MDTFELLEYLVRDASSLWFPDILTTGSRELKTKSWIPPLGPDWQSALLGRILVGHEVLDHHGLGCTMHPRHIFSLVAPVSTTSLLSHYFLSKPQTGLGLRPMRLQVGTEDIIGLA